MSKQEGFLDRLNELIGEDKPYRFAVKMDISKATFKRVLSDGKPLNADGLIKLAIKTGVSIDWLLTGKLPKYRKDVQTEPQEARDTSDENKAPRPTPPPPIDKRLLARVIDFVEAELEISGKELDTEDKAELIAQSYEQFINGLNAKKPNKFRLKEAPEQEG